MIFSKEGFSHLKFGYFILLAGIGVSIFLVAGSYLYWQSESKNDIQAQRQLSEMRNRVDAARREQQDLRDSESTYRALVARGMFAPEARLDFIEAMESLKRRHNITFLEYEMAAQRPLKLQGTSVAAIDVLSSRTLFRARTDSDANLVNFIEEFPRLQRGLFPMDRCTLKRVNTLATAPGATPRSAGGAGPQQSNADAPAAVEAECTLEWITLVNKRAPPSSPSTNKTAANTAVKASEVTR
jgi:hypothetical protein